MSAKKVFISYRRQDSRYQARLLYDALCELIPEDHVFMDIDSLQPGDEFRSLLRRWVDSCDVLLALIGTTWLDSIDPTSGERRLANPNDLVRLEIASALARGISVVPVLLDGASVPSSDQLPDDLKPLSERQCVVIEYRTFDSDARELLLALQLKSEPASETPDRPEVPAVTHKEAAAAATARKALALNGSHKTLRALFPTRARIRRSALPIALLILTIATAAIWRVSVYPKAPRNIGNQLIDEKIIAPPPPPPTGADTTITVQAEQPPQADDGSQKVAMLPTDEAPEARSPEHQLIGDALEDATKAEDATAADKAAKGSRIGSEPIATSTPGTEPGKATESQLDIKLTAAGLSKMMDVGVAWLHQYDGGKCFFIAVTGVTDKTINVKGFATDAVAFQSLYNSFTDANKIDPELNGQLINEAQCAAVDFLKTIQPKAKDNPQLTLAADRIKVGEPVSATVDKTDGKVLDLLFVDHGGVVSNVKGLASQTVSDGKTSFELPTDSFRLSKDAPEMMIALTSRSGLAVPQGKDHASAAALFPNLAHQITEQGLDVGIDFAYFRAQP